MIYCLSVGCAVLVVINGKKDTVEKKIHYDRKKKDTVVCLMGARFWRLRPEKKDTVVLGNFHYDRKKKIHYDRKKKRYSRLWREISIFFVVAGNFDYVRKKIDTVVCWQEIGSFFVVAGNFHYDRKKNKHYERKKKIQSSLAEN